MSTLSLEIMDLLGMSLGIENSLFKEFFEENESIMRLNYYPSCQKPELTKGTGPHYDPTSLTIFHQEYVGGLQVFLRQRMALHQYKFQHICGSHGQHIYGAIKWKILELLTQSCGKQEDSLEISCFLSLSKQR
ncbi:Gibberellin 20 oxidase 1 [Capsicum chinense]|nr:Gibberellin 20 oxidase 1 [Capsicum chinense]